MTRKNYLANGTPGKFSTIMGVILAVMMVGLAVAAVALPNPQPLATSTPTASTAKSGSDSTPIPSSTPAQTGAATPSNGPNGSQSKSPTASTQQQAANAARQAAAEAALAEQIRKQELELKNQRIASLEKNLYYWNDVVRSMNVKIAQSETQLDRMAANGMLISTAADSIRSNIVSFQAEIVAAQSKIASISNELKALRGY